MWFILKVNISKSLQWAASTQSKHKHNYIHTPGMNSTKIDSFFSTGSRKQPKYCTIRSWRRFFKSWISHSSAFTSCGDRQETSKHNISTEHKYCRHQSPLHTYLTGILTLRFKGHLLGRQLTSRVNIVAEVDLAERSPTEQFPPTPVYRSPWGWGG